MPTFNFVDFWGLRRIFFDIFTLYGRGDHLGHGTLTINTNFCSPFQWTLHIKFGFDWSSDFGEEVLKHVKCVLLFSNQFFKTGIKIYYHWLY